jgi:hypothetical protein
MPVELPELVRQWIPNEAFFTIPAGQFKEILKADPERLAFGVYNNISAPGATLQFSVNGLADRGINLPNRDGVWLYWQKHGSIINVAWQVSNNTGADILITLYTVTRAFGG